MSHQLKVAHLNTRASLSSWALAEIMALENNVDVFLIQDPPKGAKNHQWKELSLILPRGANPLVAILIKRSIKFCFEGRGSLRVMWAVVYSRGLKLLLMSTYVHHTSGEGADELSRALAQASKVSNLVFLGMDSNGHSPTWGPKDSDLDPVGRIVEGVLVESNLLVVNNLDSPATFKVTKAMKLGLICQLHHRR